MGAEVKSWGQLVEGVQKKRSRTEIARSGKGLRDALFEQLEKLSNGDIDFADARAFAGIAHAIIKTVEVQLKYEAMMKRGELSSDVADAMLIGEKKSVLPPAEDGDC